MAVRRIRFFGAAAVLLVAVLAFGGWTMARGWASTPQQAVDRYVSEHVAEPLGVHLQRSVILRQDSDRATAELTWARPNSELIQKVVLKYTRSTFDLGGGWAVVGSGTAPAG